MNKTEYFVLAGWRDENGNIKFDHEWSTEDARFPEGSTWNDETGEWERGNDDERDAVYFAMVNALADAGIYDGTV